MHLRERVLLDCDAGLATQQVANKYRVSTAWVRRLKQRRRQAGEGAPRPPRTPRQPRLAPPAPRIRQAIDAAPDLTLQEIKDQLGLTVSLSTLWAAVRGLGPTVKKKTRRRPSRSAAARR